MGVGEFTAPKGTGCILVEPITGHKEQRGKQGRCYFGWAAESQVDDERQGTEMRMEMEMPAGVARVGGRLTEASESGPCTTRRLPSCVDARLGAILGRIGRLESLPYVDPKLLHDNRRRGVRCPGLMRLPSAGVLSADTTCATAVGRWQLKGISPPQGCARRRMPRSEVLDSGEESRLEVEAETRRGRRHGGRSATDSAVKAECRMQRAAGCACCWRRRPRTTAE